jgi:lysophospholipid acyltransferase (LPLAT)-like uncharacterized protein
MLKRMLASKPALAVGSAFAPVRGAAISAAPWPSALPTWSAFTLNLPFSTLAIVIGDPIRVPASDVDTIETGRLRHRRGAGRSDRACL